MIFACAKFDDKYDNLEREPKSGLNNFKSKKYSFQNIIGKKFYIIF